MTAYYFYIWDFEFGPGFIKGQAGRSGDTAATADSHGSVLDLELAATRPAGELC